MSSSNSFSTLIAVSLQGSGLMAVNSIVGLECKLKVAGRTSNVLDLCRVVELVSN